MPIKKITFEKYSFALLCLIWAGLQLATWFIFDMRASVDTDLYIKRAETLNMGNWPDNGYQFYVSFIGLISVFLSFLSLRKLAFGTNTT